MALIQLLVVPIYLDRLGVEAYGLIGFCASVLITAQVLELGLSQSLTRELARYSSLASTEGTALFLSVERLYWLLAGISAAALLVAVPVIGRHVASSQLSQGTVMTALELIALLAGLQIMMNLYQAGLVGLERIRWVSLLRILTSSAAALGGVLIIVYFAPSVLALFAWNAGVLAVSALFARALLRGHLPRTPQRPPLRADLVRGLWRFASGMTAITMAAVLVSQLDRWVLIHLLPLEEFGHYALAATLSAAVYLIVSPLFGVLFPRFSFLAAQHDEASVLRIYAMATQALVASIVPLAIALALFSHDVLSLWTRNAGVSAQAAPVVSILVVGSMLNGLMNIPFALHLAYGRTGLIAAINAAGIIVLVPALLVLAPAFGPKGAALAWLAFNIVFALLAIPLTQRTVPKLSAAHWIARDVLPGAAAALLVLIAAKLASPVDISDLLRAVYLVAALGLAVLAASLAGSHTREWLLAHARKLPYALR